MPVAFHPPLEHPIDLPQPARGAEDTANGELFAALLAGAGKAPAVVSAAAKAPAVASTAGGKVPLLADIAGNAPLLADFAAKAPTIADAAGKVPLEADAASGEPDSDHRTDTTDATLIDSLNLFAAWPGADAARGSARDPGVAGSPQHGADAALARASHRVGDTADTTSAIAPANTARDAAPDALATTGNGPSGARAAPARRLLMAVHAQDRAAAQAVPANPAAAAERNSHAPTAALTASFAAAAALLAQAPDANAAGGKGISATDRHDGADASPGINLGAHAAPAAASVARSIADPVGSPGFATQVAGEIAQLVHVNAGRAELHVHPADMGPIDVTMSVRHDQVSVTMIAADPQTRAALELALPQLRDLLANQGLALANASVNDHAPRDDSRQSGARGTAARGAAIAGIDAAPPAHAPVSVALRRLVDLYA